MQFHTKGYTALYMLKINAKKDSILSYVTEDISSSLLNADFSAVRFSFER